MSTISLRLPTSLHNAAREIAKLEHVSINQFRMLAVAEKVSVLGAEDIIHERAKRGSKKKFLTILKNVPNVELKIEDRF